MGQVAYLADAHAVVFGRLRRESCFGEMKNGAAQNCTAPC